MSPNVFETQVLACISKVSLDSKDSGKASHSWTHTTFSLSFSLQVQALRIQSSDWESHDLYLSKKAGLLPI